MREIGFLILQENPCDAGGGPGGKSAAEHGFEDDLGQVGTAVLSQGADAAELDADVTEVALSYEIPSDVNIELSHNQISILDLNETLVCYLDTRLIFSL